MRDRTYSLQPSSTDFAMARRKTRVNALILTASETRSTPSAARTAAVVIAPSPHCGRGPLSGFNITDWVRGGALPPHPIVFVEHPALPSPAVGRGRNNERPMLLTQ